MTPDTPSSPNRSQRPPDTNSTACAVRTVLPVVVGVLSPGEEHRACNGWRLPEGRCPRRPLEFGHSRCLSMWRQVLDRTLHRSAGSVPSVRAQTAQHRCDSVRQRHGARLLRSNEISFCTNHKPGFHEPWHDCRWQRAGALGFPQVAPAPRPASRHAPRYRRCPWPRRARC